MIFWLDQSKDLSLESLIQLIGDEFLLQTAQSHEVLMERIEVVRTLLHLTLSKIEKNPHITLKEFIEFLERLQTYNEDLKLSVFGETPRTPVIIVPGIMGSEEKNGELVLDPRLKTYDNLKETLLANGYVQNETLFEFPYNWRKSNIVTASLLNDKIQEIKGICQCGKVDIVLCTISPLRHTHAKTSFNSSYLITYENNSSEEINHC